MAEDLKVDLKSSKKDKYALLLPQISGLIEGELDKYANAANIAAALRQSFGFFWVGFYFKASNDELVLGPFQGDIACTRIKKGKGVCGTAWEEKRTIIVDDVDDFPGHIACSSLSKSEIVVPLYNESQFLGVLDVDSDKLADFDETDQQYLEELMVIYSKSLS